MPAASGRNIGPNWLKSMEQPREGPKKLNVFAGIPVESPGVADAPFGLREAASAAGAGIEPLALICRLRHRMAGTGHGRAVQAGISMMRWLSRLDRRSRHCGCLAMALAAPAQAEKRVALVIGNDDYRERPETAEGGQRRPHHGRHAEAARLLRDGGGEPDRDGLQREPAGLRQGGREGRHRVLLLCRPRLRDRRPELSAADRCAGGDRGPGRTGARRLGSRRPHHRASAEQGRAHRDPGVRRLPQQPVRAQGHPRGRRRRRPRRR